MSADVIETVFKAPTVTVVVAPRTIAIVSPATVPVTVAVSLSPDSPSLMVKTPLFVVLTTGAAGWLIETMAVVPVVGVTIVVLSGNGERIQTGRRVARRSLISPTPFDRLMAVICVNVSRNGGGAEARAPKLA